jgi:hypothetical protein
MLARQAQLIVRYAECFYILHPKTRFLQKCTTANNVATGLCPYGTWHTRTVVYSIAAWHREFRDRRLTARCCSAPNDVWRSGFCRLSCKPRRQTMCGARLVKKRSMASPRAASSNEWSAESGCVLLLAAKPAKGCCHPSSDEATGPGTSTEGEGADARLRLQCVVQLVQQMRNSWSPSKKAVD